MKRLLFLLLIFLPSCEKDYCYDCDLHTYNSTTQDYDIKSMEYCDKTEDEMSSIIRQHNVPHLQYMVCTKRTK